MIASYVSGLLFTLLPNDPRADLAPTLLHNWSEDRDFVMNEEQPNGSPGS